MQKKTGRVNPDSADADDALCRGVLGWIGTEIFVKWKAADKSGVDTLARLMPNAARPGWAQSYLCWIGTDCGKVECRKINPADADDAPTW